ncbi:MAG TPA: twin-arginine translocation signal domain-containing protein, partial [Jatrophihabitans sp.]|nr:twin-arginine translocation signal domain-containing protein [Jatrophihabitans sp.]
MNGVEAGPGFAERLVNRVVARVGRPRPGRRGFLGGAALVGAALAVDPWSYLTRPASAYDSVCGADNTCAAGYTVFCCTINAGSNTCPPDSFIGGWWKADNSNFCGGAARYYIDCNAYRDGHYTCHCNTTTCDQRRVACNQFRYGQCNTQIPYSNTGPVLCRVVSCTPPWVQYGATCSSSSATDNNTATHAAPCLSGHPPVGSLESVTASGNLVHLKGWAYDPDLTTASIRVLVYQDGKALTVLTANVSRPDVNAARHITGNHGFSLSLAASTGTHNYKCYAINAGGGSGNSLIGVHNVAVNLGSPPTGTLESATATGNQVVLTGWAYDRDQPGSPVRLVIYADDKPYTVISTTVDRPDVNAAFGLTGTHGYRVQFAASPGRHNYKVYAHNLGAGSGAPMIGVHNVVVGSTAGQLRAETAGATAVRLTGRLPQLTGPDSADPATEFSIAVHSDDQTVHWTSTSGQAFDLTVPAGPGVHSYAVHAFDPAGAAYSIGSCTVAIGEGALGQVERVETLGRIVRISGWAFDPQHPAEQVVVSVYRDGALLSQHP